ncbi:lanC-like protein 3 [Acropora millepora]|uniref:lanC-like protein 3 n=1 Tax=Acropora millepora TaxID=45264 RepID=UPI001CF0F64F|nr:lanC-like protein 3 [Acropora millepora]
MCASRSRYFVNKYKDFSGSLGNVEYLRELVQRVLKLIDERSPPQRASCDGGLYVGGAGIGYAFYAVAQSSEFANVREQCLMKALEYMQVSLNEVSRTNPYDDGIGASFLLGHSGVYAVSVIVFNALGQHQEADQCIKKFLEMGKICQPLNFFRPGSDELFVGRAGYLCGSLLLNKKLGRTVVPLDMTRPLFDAIIESGQHYAQRHQSQSPLMYSYYRTEYLGAGHGLSSILQILLSFPEHFANRKGVEILIRQAVDYVISCEMPNGNYPPVPGEVRDQANDLVHWCHGAPGVVYLLAKAYLTWMDDKYLQAAKKCAELTWRRGLLRKGPGICHGIAGSGYVFLLLYRLTKEDLYLYRAQRFAEFMQTEEFQKEARTPDSPFSLYEGLSGTVCFYADLLKPSMAAFPFFDVFT